jgi:exodeoxyribonuclease V alpha subunit
VGVSFYIEDYVQRSIGNADPEVRALAAGCALEDWVLSDLDGHTVFPLTFLVDRLARILDSTATVARKAFSEYLANQSYHPAGTQWAPEQLVRAEVAIAKRVHSAQKEMLPPPKGLRLGDLDAAQKTAVLNAFTHKFSVITGGPGTGKTTSIKTLVAEATARNYNVQLLAPTGKAARRMSEVAGMGASTIHRYLPRNFERMHTFEETSADDMLIVDEASMVDTTLMAALLRYAPNAQIVCVGDANQLPSVGPGAVLEDLVRSDRVKTTHLQTIHRSAASSWMVREAPGILKGALSLENTSDFTFLEVKQPQDLVDVCRDMLSQYPNCQILSPRRTGALGTDRLNARLQSMIHAPGTPHTTYNEYLFYVGDPVVAVVNDYDHEIFNGDMGVVRQVSENALTVEYRNYKGTQLVEYVGLDMGCIQPAYVLSVHRYQGSEARHVVVLCHSHMGPTILTRRLLYTAVTRAKEKLHLVGDKLGVRMAVSTETRPRRTGLGLFLEDCHSWPEKVKEDL